MKNKAVGIVKQIIKAVAETAKAKTMEVRRKTRALKTRLIIFTLLQNRKTVMGLISHKLKGLMGEAQAHSHPKKLKRREEREAEEEEEEEEERLGVEVYNHNQNAMVIPPTATATFAEEEEEEENEKYPDLRHSMFEEGEGTLSVIEMVKSSKEGNGEEFRLEDEIDAVADLYIKRFHRQMWIQKHLSLDHAEQHLLPPFPP